MTTTAPIYGFISAHGKIIANTYIRIPQGFSLRPLANANVVAFNNDRRWELLRTRAGREVHFNSVNVLNSHVYREGDLIAEMNLTFESLFQNSIAQVNPSSASDKMYSIRYSIVGIITTDIDEDAPTEFTYTTNGDDTKKYDESINIPGRQATIFREEFADVIKSFLEKKEIQKKSLQYNDSKFDQIPNREGTMSPIWNTRILLSQLIKYMEDNKMQGNYYLGACRSISDTRLLDSTANCLYRQIAHDADTKEAVEERSIRLRRMASQDVRLSKFSEKVGYLLEFYDPPVESSSDGVNQYIETLIGSSVEDQCVMLMRDPPSTSEEKGELKQMIDRFNDVKTQGSATYGDSWYYHIITKCRDTRIRLDLINKKYILDSDDACYVHDLYSKMIKEDEEFKILIKQHSDRYDNLDIELIETVAYLFTHDILTAQKSYISTNNSLPVYVYKFLLEDAFFQPHNKMLKYMNIGLINAIINNRIKTSPNGILDYDLTGVDGLDKIISFISHQLITMGSSKLSYLLNAYKPPVDKNGADIVTKYIDQLIDSRTSNEKKYNMLMLKTQPSTDKKTISEMIGNIRMIHIFGKNGGMGNSWYYYMITKCWETYNRLTQIKRKTNITNNDVYYISILYLKMSREEKYFNSMIETYMKKYAGIDIKTVAYLFSSDILDVAQTYINDNNSLSVYMYKFLLADDFFQPHDEMLRYANVGLIHGIIHKCIKRDRSGKLSYDLKNEFSKVIEFIKQQSAKKMETVEKQEDTQQRGGVYICQKFHQRYILNKNMYASLQW